MDISPTIEIYFLNSKDSCKAFTVYDVKDNDEHIRFCPFIFYDIPKFYENDNDDKTYFLPLEILQNRFKYMKTQVKLPKYIHSRVETMLQNIEKKQEIYYGIRVIF